MGLGVGRVVGSVITPSGTKPFTLDLETGDIELGSFVKPEAAQAAFSDFEKSGVRTYVVEHLDIEVNEVRVGEYLCYQCQRWIDVTRRGRWSISMCMSCSLDRASDLWDHYNQ